MTSVYGVTFIGARDQILARLTDVNDADGFFGREGLLGRDDGAAL